VKDLLPEWAGPGYYLTGDWSRQLLRRRSYYELYKRTHEWIYHKGSWQLAPVPDQVALLTSLGMAAFDHASQQDTQQNPVKRPGVLCSHMHTSNSNSHNEITLHER